MLQMNRLASFFSATSRPVRRLPSPPGKSINKLAWGRFLSNPTRPTASGSLPATPMIGPAIACPIASLLVGSSLLASHSTGTKAPLANQPPTIATNHHNMANLFHNEWICPVGTLAEHFRASSLRASARFLVRLSHSTCSTGQPSRVGLTCVTTTPSTHSVAFARRNARAATPRTRSVSGDQHSAVSLNESRDDPTETAIGAKITANKQDKGPSVIVVIPPTTCGRW